MTISQSQTAGVPAAASPAAIRWLALAATPTFAVMAALSGLGGDSADVLCTTHGAFPLTGMVPMYLLMSVFHASPWLTLMSGDHRGRLS